MEKRDKMMIVCAAVIFASAMVLSWLAGKHSWAMTTDGESVRRDTVTVIDTVVHRVPAAKDSTVVRYVTRTVPVKGSDGSTANKTDTFLAENYAQNNGENMPPLYASASSDSATVMLPITQKMYSDTDYRAWVSGYEPRLDSIKVYPRTVTVMETKYKPPSRFSIGLQGGYGITPKGLQPYIGVGVNVRIF